MWQNYNDHRIIFNVQTFEMGQFRKKIRILFDDTTNTIDPKIPVYVKIPFRETVFKGEVSQLLPREVFLTLPQEIHMREFRENLRTRFEPGKKHVSLRPVQDSIAADKLPVFKTTIMDISQAGMGLLISDNNLHFFKKGSLIDLLGMGETEMAESCRGEVVHIAKLTPLQAKKIGFPYRLGVRMNEKIPEQLLSVFCSPI